mgnify:CR=1 FL=1
MLKARKNYLPASGGTLRHKPIQPRQDAIFAEHFDEVIKAWANGAASAGQAQGMDNEADFDPELGGGFFGGGIEGVGAKILVVRESVAERLDDAAIFSGEVFARSFFDFDLGKEIKIGESFHLGELLHLLLAGGERGIDVFGRESFDLDAVTGEGLGGELVEALLGHEADVLAVEPVEFVDVEARVVPENLRQVEHLDDFRQRHNFAIFLRRPAKEVKIIDHRFGGVTPFHVGGQGGALVALAHFAALRVENERNMGVSRRLDAERFEEGEVLGRVGEMIFAADHVGNFHFEIVHDVDEMKDGLAVRTDDDEVRIKPFAVGQFAMNIADDQVWNRYRLAFHPELDRAFVFVSKAFVAKFLDTALVVFATLGLEVRAEITFAQAGRIAGERAFIPFEAEPAQAIENDIDGFLGIARSVGVLNPENEGSAGVFGVKPIEQGGARPANMEVTGRTWCKPDSNVHQIKYPQKRRGNDRGGKVWAQESGKNRVAIAKVGHFYFWTAEHPSP